jgi:hypothetical protein
MSRSTIPTTSGTPATPAPSNSPGWTTTSFHAFSLFPIEIQLTVWRWHLYARGPAVVGFERADTSALHKDGDGYSIVTTHRMRGYYVKSAPPDLYTCHTSRRVALTSYPSCFEGRLAYPIMFDPYNDLMLMQDLYAFSSLLGWKWNAYLGYAPNAVLRNGLKHIAVLGDWRRFTGLLLSRLSQFDHLDTIILESNRIEWDVSMLVSTADWIQDRLIDIRKERTDNTIDKDSAKGPKVQILSRWQFA